MPYLPAFERDMNRLSATGKVNTQAHLDLLYGVADARQAGFADLVLDFSACPGAFPNGMVPILCTVDRLRSEEMEVDFILPRDAAMARLFQNTNWAHFLSPEKYPKSDSTFERHLATQHFRDAAEQRAAVDGLLEVILRTIEVPREQLQALEWSLNEVTDNVLNHAEAPHGGYVQATAFKEDVTFTVADGGMGILASLRQGFPSLPDDVVALGEAVKFGVTRGRDHGAGNGLAGTMRLATASGGRFELTSGRGRLRVFMEEKEAVSDKKELPRRFDGTIVSATLSQTASSKMEEALNMTATRGGRWDFLDAEYTTDDDSAFRLVLRSETPGVGSREAGRQLRMKCNNLLQADSEKGLVLDWSGIPVVASSFADEAVGRLFKDLGPLQFMRRVRLVGMTPLVAQLLEKAITERA